MQSSGSSIPSSAVLAPVTLVHYSVSSKSRRSGIPLSEVKQVTDTHLPLAWEAELTTSACDQKESQLPSHNHQ